MAAVVRAVLVGHRGAGPGPPDRTAERLYARLGHRTGRRRAERLAEAGEIASRLTPARVAAIAVALLVHLFTLLLVVTGIVLLVRGWWNVFADLAAVALLLMAVLMRPRFGTIPEGAVVGAGEAPATHALVGAVAAELRTREPDVLVVSHEWNAGYARVGIRRRRVLVLGLPLLTALSPQERVALVAHELAHERHGDSTRGLVCGGAVGALAEAYAVLEPSDGPTIWDGLHKAVFWVLSRPVLALLVLEVTLLGSDMQRAEYLADDVAADVAGTDAAVSLSEMVLLGPTFDAIVAANVYPGRRGETRVFADLDAAVTAVTPHERERRRRVARLEESRFAATHPPTALRIELLERRPHRPPAVLLAAADSAAIDDELARHRAPIAERLVDEARDRLYY